MPDTGFNVELELFGEKPTLTSDFMMTMSRGTGADMQTWSPENGTMKLPRSITSGIGVTARVMFNLDPSTLEMDGEGNRKFDFMIGIRNGTDTMSVSVRSGMDVTSPIDYELNGTELSNLMENLKTGSVILVSIMDATSGNEMDESLPPMPGIPDEG